MFRIRDTRLVQVVSIEIGDRLQLLRRQDFYGVVLPVDEATPSQLLYRAVYMHAGKPARVGNVSLREGYNQLAIHS